MKDARDILEKTNAIWFEEMTNETDSSAKIIAAKYFETSCHMRSSSPDNKLLVCVVVNNHEQRVVVYELPSLTLIFELYIGVMSIQTLRSHIVFSPDSSYFLLNSLQTCISIQNRNEVPFIPHGPTNIVSCAFSSCGTKLVTLDEDSIKLWDVRKKEILAVRMLELNENEMAWFDEEYELVFFSISESCILLFKPFTTFRVFDSITLNTLEIKELSTRSARYDHCIQIFSHSYDDLLQFNPLKFGIDQCWQLQTGENILCVSKKCSKPFTWNGKKCVTVCNGDASLVVYDYINQEVIDTFQMSSPCFVSVDYVSNLGGNNFLICFNSNFAFVVSLERSSEFLAFPFLSPRAYPIFCALSSDKLYLACSYGYPVLKIMNVDNGKTLQIVEPKQKPIACWWSKLYLWVVCDGLVVVKYSYNATETQIVGNCVEECSFDCQGEVLKFAEGVLVTRMDKEISISKICYENLSPQQKLDSKSEIMYLPKVAISTDGSAVLIYGGRGSDGFELWEIGCDEKWDLISTGTLFYSIQHGYLTGGKNSRRVLLFSDNTIHSLSCFRSSSEYQNATQICDSRFSVFPFNIVYLDSNLLVGHSFFQIYFIDVSAGEVITSIDVGFADDFFFVPSKRLLLLFRGGGVIEYLKIHNIDKYYLPLPPNLG
jgi:hypothetical protein